ncbi:hypothetical protein CL644_02585 [bacterium]|nr:hypothetical protein [Parcubacteria group bacterium]MBF05571.1 hypothetical protein [bacterium]|tara:strand:+ start:5924 stop:6994 length:1071 start_codon:yes stop_codon:yes gene_type:complete
MSDNSEIASEFSQPFEKGHEAIISSTDNLHQQILSFLLFVVGLGIVCGIAVLIGISFFVTDRIPPLVSFAVITVSCLIFGIAGQTKVKPAENAVPELFGALSAWWIVPSGISWWPFGKVNGRHQQVYIGELAVTFDFTKIESIDNVQMQSSITVRFRIKYPLVFARHGRTGEDSQAVIALHGLQERTLRWYVSSKLSTNLPSAKGEASKILSGIQTSFSADTIPGSHSSAAVIRFGVDDSTADGRTIREIAEDLSFEILEVLVKDFTLPQALTNAAERARIEEAEREAESIEIETFITLIKKVKGVDLDNVSDAQIIDAIQAERGKIQRIVVDGSAPSLVQAGALVGGLDNKEGDR